MTILQILIIVVLTGCISNPCTGSRVKRQALTSASNKWDNPIPYKIHSSVANPNKIKQAIKLWEQNTCLKFAENKDGGLVFYEGNNATFYHGLYHCHLYTTGKHLNGNEQAILLYPSCAKEIGTIVREIGHVLGIVATQKRYDRDNYVTIYEEHIHDKMRNSLHEMKRFSKETPETSNNYDVDYEYGSIFHENSGSVPKSPVLVARDHRYQHSMGNKYRLTFNDILLMNKHYNCLGKCLAGGKPCQNGGYRNPRNCEKCICPRGFGGSDCSGPSKPEHTTKCGGTLIATSSHEYLSASLGDKNFKILDNFKVCYWHIKARAGEHVEITVDSVKAMAYAGCPNRGLEIIYENLTQSGARLCDFSHAQMFGTVTSTTNLAIVSLYTNQNVAEFSLRYRSVRTAPTPKDQLTCTEDARCSLYAVLGLCNDPRYYDKSGTLECKNNFQDRACVHRVCKRTCYDCKPSF